MHLPMIFRIVFESRPAIGLASSIPMVKCTCHLLICLKQMKTVLRTLTVQWRTARSFAILTQPAASDIPGTPWKQQANNIGSVSIDLAMCGRNRNLHRSHLRVEVQDGKASKVAYHARYRCPKCVECHNDPPKATIFACPLNSFRRRKALSEEKIDNSEVIRLLVGAGFLMCHIAFMTMDPC
ncbi:hypothetical protein BJ165DRAFT_1466989 [Panaeolus papilionaceus]|nr:hypothetical protein BJ165DRAFT_1466989 [Panaeolus papilionaceus]